MTETLLTLEYKTVSHVSGPLLVAERMENVGYGDVVDVVSPAGDVRRGQVLELDRDRVVIQVLEGTRGLDRPTTAVLAHGRSAQTAVGRDLVGRILDGSGRPIDGLNTLVRGQKLPIFSGFGLPAAELSAQIAAQARVVGDDAEASFVVVFAAMGITEREASFFRRSFEQTAALERAVLVLNLAEDPPVERLLTPRIALTIAEHLGFDLGLDVLVILTDITSYCEALREVSSARGEIPGRRGYPGYMYTDLASLFERAGRIRGRRGSVTQLAILTMPDDDITHPIPDLTGYITEGQIVLSRDLDRRGIAPPIDVLPSLSRLMNAGIGAGKTRADHRAVADQLYAFFGRARELRRLVAIVGEAALSDGDRRLLRFADAFERRFVHQGAHRRTIEDTLDLAWTLFADFPAEDLGRIDPALVERHRRP